MQTQTLAATYMQTRTLAATYRLVAPRTGLEEVCGARLTVPQAGECERCGADMHTRECVRETLSCAWRIVPEGAHVQRERDLGAAFDVSLRPVTLPSFAAIPCPRHEAGACERERRAEETGAHAHAHENACEPNPPRCPCKTHANEFASLLYCTVSLLSAGCSRSRRRVGRPSVWSCCS